LWLQTHERAGIQRRLFSRRLSLQKQGGIDVKIKTLLVDDSVSYLTVARRYLATQPVELVGEAQNQPAALEMMQARCPELVLLDLVLGDDDGLALLRVLKARPAPPRVIIVTLHDQDEYRDAAYHAGADGFISKRDFATDFPQMLHRIFQNAGFIKSSGS
jgi:DNA-binding NarL/FixJ family response regulator